MIAEKPTSSPHKDDRAAATVFYDGACPICRREISWYRDMAGSESVEWRDVSTGPVPDGMDRAALLGRFTVRRRNGRLADGADGFVALWRALGPTRLLGRAMDRQPFPALGEVAYRAFLKLRPLWRA